MQLFYHSELKATSSNLVFDKKESGHIIKVLRKKEGDKLFITNGKGFLFEAQIQSANPNKCQVEIIESKFFPPKDYFLHLAVAPTKKNDRYEWFLEKATELGIDQITPVICEHNERRKVNLQRFERIIESGMKQSLQYYLPTLNQSVSLVDFLQKDFEGEKYIAHCEPSEKKLLKDVLQPKKKIHILIGPEGDFSPREIELALKKGFLPVSLGENRLRTETAAIAACHAVYFVNQ